MVFRVALFVPLLIAALRSCGEPAPVTHTAARELGDSVGVNLHLEYDQTPYADAAGVAAALRFLGIRHVRDAAMRSGVEREPRFAEVARSGVSFDLFFNRDLRAQLPAAQRLAGVTSKALELLEGPNEANQEPLFDHPAGDARATRAYQAKLYALIRQTPQLAKVSVASFTYWPPLAGRADLVNFHAYPHADKPLAPQLAWLRRMAEAVQPAGMPVVCTETGFTTGGIDHLSETRQAELEPVLLLENFRAHVRRTYLYELFDERSDVAQDPAERENHWGLFRSDRSPKPAAYALQRMMTLLAFAPTGGRPHPWARVSGLNVRSLQVDGAEGRRLTFLWRTEAQTAGTRDLSIDLGADATARLIDLASGRALALPSGPSQATLEAGVSVVVQSGG